VEDFSLDIYLRFATARVIAPFTPFLLAVFSVFSVPFTGKGGAKSVVVNVTSAHFGL
jgi:hypothetical protein